MDTGGGRQANTARDGTLEAGAVAALTVLGGALRLWAIGAQPYWLDEAFSVWVAGHGVRELVRFVATVDHHPPLYYVLLHMWQGVLGDGEATVRLLSAILGTATIPLFYLGGRLLVYRRAALIAALLLAVSPFHVRYGQEARMYAQMSLLAAGMLWSLAAWLAASAAGSRRRHVAMAGLAATQTALMLTHNSAAILAPVALNLGVLAPWLWNRGRRVSALPALDEERFLRGWLAVQAAVLIVWLLWMPSFLRQSAAVLDEFWIPPLTGYSVWLTFHNFNLAFPDGWFPGSPWVDLLFWGLAAGGVYALHRRGAVAFLLAVLFLAPASLELAISAYRPILYDRTLIWTTLPYFLLVGSGLSGLAIGLSGGAAEVGGGNARTGTRPVLAAAALTVMLGLSVYSLLSYYGEFKKEDWPGAAAYVTGNAAASDLVLFSAPWAQIPFEYYARPAELPEARGMPVDLFGRGELESRMEQSDVEHLRQVTANRDGVWLVYAHEWYTDPEGLIPAELARSMKLLEERTFNGPRVLYYIRQ